MDVTQEEINDLREQFFEKLSKDGPPDSRDFHSADIERINTSDDWLRRFLIHHENNIQNALKMLWDTCEWRRNFGTNDICESNIRRDYLEDGVCFGYGKDKDGKKLFVIKSKLHTKSSRDFSELQRCIIYWFERLEREGKGDQISLFFDMVDAGISNLDMDLSKYLIGLFKNYYPNYLNYIIILEMPWVLNAAFNIIKSWLPAKAIPKIKFVKKATLEEFVDPDDALKCWGGNNDFSFIFISEGQAGLVNGKVDRKVHFEGTSSTSEEAPDFEDPKTKKKELLLVEPDILSFDKSGNESVGTIVLKNPIQDQILTYKIKTTSPEKFKVRPNTGILTGLQNVTITITLQQGYSVRSLLSTDRFLIMCLPISENKLTTQELAEYWKTNSSKAESHRLICRDSNDPDSVKSNLFNSMGSPGEHSISTLLSKVSQLESQNQKVQKELNFIKRLLYFSFIVVLFLLCYICHIILALQGTLEQPVTNKSSSSLRATVNLRNSKKEF